MSHEILDELYGVIMERRAHPIPESYTARLFAEGTDEILKKVGEESVEVILAGKGQSDARVASEAADLLYHLLVLLVARGVTLADVERELQRRRR